MSIAEHQHPPQEDKKRPGTVRTLLRILPFAKSAAPRIVLGMVAALLASLVALIIPQVLRWLVDGPLSTGDSARCGPRLCSWSVSACRRGRVHLPASLVRAHPGHARRGEDAQRTLRQAAGSAGRVPRPLAERPAALARRERPEPHPPLDLVRHRAARGQRGHDRGRVRHPDLVELDSRAASSWCARSRSGSTASCSRASTRRSRAAARIRPATSRPPSRSRCTASACSRRSAAASTR